MDRDEDKMVRLSAAAPPVVMQERAKDLGVTIEAKLTVGEYQVLILSTSC